MAKPSPLPAPLGDAAPTGHGTRVPLGTMLAYGPPMFGFAAALFFVQFFFLKFATDVLLIAPAVVGIIFALSRLWDAVTDPVAGTLSDRTRTRLGRRRPWMLVSAPLMAVTMYLLYVPPAALSGALLHVWVVVALFAFYAALTAYIVPHAALGAELTEDHHDRSRVFGLRHAFFTLGMMAAFAGMQFVNNAEDPRLAAMWWASGTGVLLVVLLMIPPWRIRERGDYQGRGSEHPLHAMADVLKNPHARLLLFVQCIEMAGAGILGVLSPYLMQYILKRPDLIGPLPAVFVVFSVISIPFWVRASRRFGKKNTWIFAMVCFGLSFGCTGLVLPGQWVFMTLVMVAAGISTGCGGAVGPSILADVIDYDEYMSGERKEGAYSAAWGFSIKFGNAIVIFVTGVALQLSGFEPNAEQSLATEITLRSLSGGLPFVLFMTGALVFRHFGLDDREHARIRAELDRRAAAG